MISLTEKEVQELLTYLGDVPAKFANPLIGFLQTKIKQTTEKDVVDGEKDLLKEEKVLKSEEN